MKLVPLFDRVVLKQLVAEETTKSGIVLPGQAKEKPQQAEVIAVGPGGVVDGKEIKIYAKANAAELPWGEIGVDVVLAKRAGLLHDIGKAIDHEMEGSHVEIGGEIAKKFRESDLIVNAILAHHGDCEPKSVEAVLVSAADAVSAARPGARRETLESYLKRLTRLEEISESFEGVEKCYAVQAGREIRIMVKPDVIDDASAVLLARDISKKIEAEMEYPGQIKVVIIRETRAVDYAK